MSFNKVFGIGLTSTGTRSLNDALNLLGIKAKHYPDDGVTIRNLSNGMVELPILEEFDALTDVQTIPFYQQFDKQYPGSKFILTVRAIDAWAESTKLRMGGQERPREVKEFRRSGLKSSVQWVRTATYGIVCWDREVFKTRYVDHIRNCKAYFEGRDDLLIMNICEGDGWELLCPFLGKEIPNVDFPQRGE